MQSLQRKPLPARVHIREAEESDLEALEWDGEFSHYRFMFAETYQLTQLGRAKIWIAEERFGSLIGQIFVSLKGVRADQADGKIRAYVFGFRVRPAFRNQGLGTLMMHKVEDDLRRNHYQYVTLNVAKDNMDARRFYERLGYRVIGDDPGHWSYVNQFGQRQDMREPAWRMQKELSL